VKLKIANAMKGKSEALMSRELTVGASQSFKLKDSALEWPTMS